MDLRRKRPDMCDSGQDAYALAQVVGVRSQVAGVDMFVRQLHGGFAVRLRVIYLQPPCLNG